MYFFCYDVVFDNVGGQVNGIQIENTTISHIDRCKFNHSQISLKTWDCKITNTWIWALWRPYGIGIHGGSGNINIFNVDVVPPFQHKNGDKNSEVIGNQKAGIWINSLDGNITNNIILNDIYLDGNPKISTGVGLLIENVFGITCSNFRANKMNSEPIIIDSSYNIDINGGKFYENNKYDNGVNEIIIRKSIIDAKHDNIRIHDNDFINYLKKNNPASAIKISSESLNVTKVYNNSFSQSYSNSAYTKNVIETSGKPKKDMLYRTNMVDGNVFRSYGSCTLPKDSTGFTLTI
ncbi:hypothetical protein CYK85_15595, partial [Clostridium perfringens]